MFSLPDSWVWDFWFADDGEHYHLFFLYASRALKDPDARHFRASIGHAVSTDLRHWERVEDALVRSDTPAFDDLATWTGSIVRSGDGLWHMFYTGSSRSELSAEQAAQNPSANVQSIGLALSHDLYRWEKQDAVQLRADPQWYETLADGTWREEAFRDPWVFADPHGHGWHMLITARAKTGEPLERGVVAHAISEDLRNWQMRTPLSQPGAGFGHLEVLQSVEIDGAPYLFFSCTAQDLAPWRLQEWKSGGIWALRASSLTGPFEVTGARLVSDERFYVGRVLVPRDGRRPLFFAFHNIGAGGQFIGAISDPLEISVQGADLTISTISVPEELPGE